MNEVTIKNRYLLPLITETIDRLAGASVLTKLDLKDAYHRLLKTSWGGVRGPFHLVLGMELVVGVINNFAVCIPESVTLVAPEFRLPSVHKRGSHPAILRNVDEARFRPNVINFNDFLKAQCRACR